MRGPSDDLNEDYENELAKRRASSWASGDHAARLAEVRRVTGIRTLAELPKPQVEQCGVVERDGFRIEKLAIAPEKGVVLPALLFLPERPKPGSVVLYLHDQGKSADAGPNGPIEQRVRAGETVLAVDLRGMGQTHPAENDYYSHSRQDDYYSRSWQDAYTAYLLGRSYVGMRADDILVCTVGRRNGWRRIETAPYRWRPSATSASPPSTPPFWSQRCFRT